MGYTMENTITTNRTQGLQENTNKSMNFRLLSKEEAEQKNIRSRLDPEVFARYANFINQIKASEDGDWGIIQITDTEELKTARKYLLLVARKLHIPLVTKRVVDGLLFRVATAAEVTARKKD